MFKSTVLALAAVIASSIFMQGCNSDSAPGNTLGAIQAAVQCEPASSDHPAAFVSANECLKRTNLVIDSSNNIYEVSDIFSDGRIEVTGVGSSKTILSPGTYWPEVFNISGYSIDETSEAVIDGNDNRYWVAKIFANGLVQLNYRQTAGRTILDIRDLAVSVHSYGAIEVNGRVIDRENNRYWVREIYSNGRLYVEYESSSGDTFLNAADVAVSE